MNFINPIILSKKIPQYGYPISRSVISLDNQKLLSVLHIKGIPFEVSSSSELENSFLTIKGFLNQLANSYGNKLGIWTHIVKSKDDLDQKYKFENKFINEFTLKYINTFKNNNFYKTDYYLTFIYDYNESLENSLNDFEDLLKIASSVLKKFECELLEINDHGTRCKNIEFLSYILNFNKNKYPLTKSKIKDIIGRSDWHFGYDVLEIRNTESLDSKYATFFELESLPLSTEIGMWDFILKQKCEFILTQSMILMKPLKSVSMLEKQINLVSSADNAEHEIEEIQNAKDYVATGEISFGDYHCTLAVLSNSINDTINNGNDFVSEFLARGTILKRSNLKSQYSFMSMMPASKYRIKSSPRTTTNLACTFSLHNYSQGKKNGNPIGDGTALIPLKTISDTIFYLNCHASELNKNVTGEKYAGHVLILGATGSGKTTLEGTITAFTTRFNPQIFTIDYNRSTELFMKAFGAEYFSIKEGFDTGLNPFQLNKTPELVSFLNRLVCRLCSNNDDKLNEFEEEEIKNGIDSVLRLDQNKRSLSMLLQTIVTLSLRSKLSKWCRLSNGHLSWCLDSPINKFDPNKMDRIGFDSTILLEGKGHIACEPILATLFFLKDLMQKQGRLFLSIVEEFWMPANFPLTQNLMKKVLKAGRLKNEFMIMSSQSPEDAINCEIFPAIVQQTATKIFLPNPDAEFKSYEKCNVNENEFLKLKKLDKTSRIFLIKQSNTSCFCKLDLHGFEKYLPIISGSTDDIIRSEEIIKEYGSNPDDWVPVFQKYIATKI